MRVCAVETCDTVLSRYNDESVCAPCVRAGRRPKKKRMRVTKREAPHLRAYRRQAGWSKRELAIKAGVSTTTIRRAERGELISLTSIEKMAKPLNLKRGDLTGRGKG